MRLTYPINVSNYTALAFAGTIAFASSVSAQVRYELVVPEVMGTPVNHVSAQSNEINENGETLLNRISTFAVWNDGAITHIASGLSEYPATFSSINASSINPFQQVVGSKTYLHRDESGNHFDTFPFYWDPSNGLVDLDELGARTANGAGNTVLYEINEDGLALGSTQLVAEDGRSGSQAFTWSFAQGRADIQPLHSFENHSVTTPHGLNALGTVVGVYRQFNGSIDSYHERAFIFDSANGSRDLSELDSNFFQSDHYTARDINDSENLVGERDRVAYFYDLQSKVGLEIRLKEDAHRATRAFALNNNDVVAGTVENDSASASSGFAPFIWTRNSGAVELLPHFMSALEQILPAGVDPMACRITPKSINSSATLSASLQTPTSFSREIVLKPVLDFRWNSNQVVAENGVAGVKYTHDKEDLNGSIPAAALGYEIAFECSSDMKTWHPVSSENNGIRHLETETSIELFLPFAQCTFVRPVLKRIQEGEPTGY
ncbi:hypothetical protein IEN85_12065 [Pelagicoccus sp. NFK12]|uniref:YD repeat-containing protein n=1 Tax=Pelagicoccus enzymogenes TaxID=2773457 RepID=A0A927F9B7_9BACT|nr:hypothetical protein [Pelagicoccus enzymogenes]MBD5780229.1 hypothetical protein [Pelagicoccus enzymogenes]